MLFTRCPDCGTTFRVTDDALKKANGQVRCGRCASVFNAYTELREPPSDAEAAQDAPRATHDKGASEPEREAAAKSPPPRQPKAADAAGAPPAQEAAAPQPTAAAPKAVAPAAKPAPPRSPEEGAAD